MSFSDLFRNIAGVSTPITYSLFKEFKWILFYTLVSLYRWVDCTVCTGFQLTILFSRSYPFLSGSSGLAVTSSFVRNPILLCPFHKVLVFWEVTSSFGRTCHLQFPFIVHCCFINKLKSRVREFILYVIKEDEPGFLTWYIYFHNNISVYWDSERYVT